MQTDPGSTAGNPAEVLAALLSAFVAAKYVAADAYRDAASRAPDERIEIILLELSDAEKAQAATLETERGVRRAALPEGAGAAPAVESWSSAFMLAFALDQSATAAMAGLIGGHDEALSTLAADILEEERDHQSLVLGELRALAKEDPEIGRRLATDMVASRDWIRAVLPRHARLEELAIAEFAAPDAAKIHDRFLANLGDRMQEALGVLGD
jgi:1,2-phenylacetyl-CoA epoxidase catalytic subunit